jgi:hypothetical protein
VGLTTSSGSAHNLQFEDLLIQNFGTAVQFGYNAYLDSFRDIHFFYNAVSLSAPATAYGGERMVLSNCVFAGSTQGINDAVGFEWMLDNVSFDQLTGVAITIVGTAGIEPGQLRISHSHFETPTSGLPANGFIYSPSGPVTIDIHDTTFLTSTAARASPQAFITASAQTAQVNVIGGYAYATPQAEMTICVVKNGASVWLQSMAGTGPPYITPSASSCNLPTVSKVSNMFGSSF